jgi:hypothetical protein
VIAPSSTGRLIRPTALAEIEPGGSADSQSWPRAALSRRVGGVATVGVDVYEVAERWRGIAILQSDPEAYRRTIRRAAELGTGQPSPDDEALDVTTTKAGLQRMYTVEPVGDDIDASIAALPPELLEDFAELRAALDVSPWTVGRPLVPTNPEGLRVATIGAAGTGQPGRLPRPGTRAVRLPSFRSASSETRSVDRSEPVRVLNPAACCELAAGQPAQRASP